MKLFVLSSCMVLFFTFSSKGDCIASFDDNEVALDHSEWNQLLKRYVDTNGNVNYQAFKKDEKVLDAYLKKLADDEPLNTSKPSEKLAYFINLYNAATVKLILENYPPKSIKDIQKPWDREWIKVGTKTYSLGQIEHNILRKMEEPRIHFAINCASYSCPKLLNEAFLPSKLETQLQKVTSDFINDTKRNIITSEKIEISSLFKWFKSDFTTNTSLIKYIQNYSNISINADAKISFMNYDWRLNETE